MNEQYLRGVTVLSGFLESSLAESGKNIIIIIVLFQTDFLSISWFWWHTTFITIVHCDILKKNCPETTEMALLHGILSPLGHYYPVRKFLCNKNSLEPIKVTILSCEFKILLIVSYWHIWWINRHLIVFTWPGVKLIKKL